MGNGYDKSVDWYSLGVMLYEMMVGRTPHDADNTLELFRNIVNDPVKYPKNLDKRAKRLIKGLLNKDPSKRICNQEKGVDAIKQCSFFKGLDFSAILEKKLEPPFFPSVKSDDDTSNFKKFAVPMLHKENCPSLPREEDIFLNW